MSRRTAPPKRKRLEDSVRVVEVDEPSGAIDIELTRLGRKYLTTIAGDDSVTMIEAAALCGVTRSTVYNWAKPVTRSYGYSSRPKTPLATEDGRVELPELRRYLNDLGRWWLSDHPAAEKIAKSAGGGE